MIITLIGSFTQGITNTATGNFTDMLGGQIYITGQELTSTGAKVTVIRDRNVIEDAIDHVGIRIAERTVRSRAVGEIIFGSKTTTVSIEGVDWADEPKLAETLDIKTGSVSIDMPERALVIPEYTAEDLGVEVGETVLIRTSTVTGQQNVGEFDIQGITNAGSIFSFSSAYASRAYLNGVIGLEPDDYQVLNIALEDTTQAAAVTDALLTYLRAEGRAEPASDEGDGMRARMENMMALMGGSGLFTSRVDEADRWQGTRFNVLNIDDMMESVNSMVNVLNTVSYVIFIILVVITMIGLLNTFRMVLIERTNEIGTMRAIGMQRGEVRNIFLSEALALALSGAISGLAIAFILQGILSIIPI